MKIKFTLSSIFVFIALALNAQNDTFTFDPQKFDGSLERKQAFIDVLGEFPDPPPLKLDTLEKVELEGGIRYKIVFTVELPDSVFDTPEDRIPAYLFVPDHEVGQKLPAILAIHQDGASREVGKSEVAGLAGDEDQDFGLELFKRGYVVICPDRYYHAERRRIPGADTATTDWDRNDVMLSHWNGQLVLNGRTPNGKEVYDMERTVDVLCSYPFVDTSRIGAIGHSGGGFVMVFHMFMDDRIKVGVSSCGFFEVLNYYNEHGPKKRGMDNALSGLTGIGKSADFLAFIAPRPVLLTRGSYEWGGYYNDNKWRDFSIAHVEEMKEIERYARLAYDSLSASDHLKTIYFDENKGLHSFPPGVKKEVYQWIDQELENDYGKK